MSTPAEGGRWRCNVTCTVVASTLQIAVQEALRQYPGAVAWSASAAQSVGTLIVCDDLLAPEVQ
jgi:hypothetical protein